MRGQLTLAAIAFGCLCATASAVEHDYYRYLPYPKALVPGVGRDKVEQEGGPNTAGYHRRTVHWWPRKGQDIVDVPEGVPPRVWTRNKGQEDKEALAGICRNWTASDPETFEAHLIGFRSFGTSTVFPNLRYSYVPVAVLRMAGGEQRAVLDHADICQMLSPQDLACGRNQDQFFRGRIDHFRIYRKVHDDFDSLGPPPLCADSNAGVVGERPAAR